ncbi:hypothetical protein QQP08_020442 [Theobroma cacao]|nr:hypothetical protein QQP08_020442 [Theobroma cacao]
MSREQKKGKQEKGGTDVAEKVVVAVKASKEIPKTALVWALTHVVQPGDCITLLVVVPSHGSGRKWGFPRFAGDCASGSRKSQSGSSSEQKSDITDSCSQMILQLHDVYDPNKHPKSKNGSSGSIRGPAVTPTSSPELGTPFTATEAGTSSVSSSDPGTSPFFISEGNGDLKKEESIVIKENQDLDESSSDTESENLSLSSASLRFQPWITEYLTSHHRSSQHLEETSVFSCARPLLEEYAIDELVDPRLGDCYSEHEVLRILEGDMLMDTNYTSPGYDVGNRSGRIWAEQKQHYSGPLVNEASEGFSGKLSLEGLRPGTRRKSCEEDL